MCIWTRATLKAEITCRTGISKSVNVPHLPSSSEPSWVRLGAQYGCGRPRQSIVALPVGTSESWCLGMFGTERNPAVDHQVHPLSQSAVQNSDFSLAGVANSTRAPPCELNHGIIDPIPNYHFNNHHAKSCRQPLCRNKSLQRVSCYLLV